MTALSPEELSTESLAEVMAAGGRPADSEREIKIIDTPCAMRTRVSGPPA